MNRLYFLLLSAISIYGMFAQGLYFDHKAYPVFIMIQFLFLIWLLKHVLHKQKLSKSIFLMILLPGVYALPLLFQPATMLGSVNGLLRVTSYVALFVMLGSIYHQDKRLKDFTPYVMQSFSFILMGDVLFQLFTQVEGALYIHRFESYIEYPNTFAVIIAVSYTHLTLPTKRIV